jgi:glucose/mannose transport system substrate-binding protein
MGDWAQGEFLLLDKVAGQDYTCLPGLGVNEYLSTGGDAFYFPKTMIRKSKRRSSSWQR